MGRMNTNLKVGLFVLAGSITILVAMIGLSASAIFRTTIPAETYIDESVQGLDIGSPVKQRGVQIGKVSKIGFVRNEYPVDASDPNYYRVGRLVLINIDLYPKAFDGISHDDIEPLLKKLVENGLRIRLASQGLTGAAYLEIDYLSGAAKPFPISWDPRSYYIPSAPSTISQLTSAAEDVFKNLEHTDVAKMINEATGLLEDLRQTNSALQVLLNGKDVAELRDELKGTVKDAHHLVTTSSADAAAAITDLRKASEQLLTLTATLNQTFGNGDLQRTLANANGASADIKALTAKLPQTLAQVDNTVKRLDGILLSGQGDVTTTLDNLAATSQNLRELTENAKRYPSQVLFGAPPPASQGSRP